MAQLGDRHQAGVGPMPGADGGGQERAFSLLAGTRRANWGECRVRAEHDDRAADLARRTRRRRGAAPERRVAEPRHGGWGKEQMPFLRWETALAGAGIEQE